MEENKIIDLKNQDFKLRLKMIEERKDALIRYGIMSVIAKNNIVYRESDNIIISNDPDELGKYLDKYLYDKFPLFDIFRLYMDKFYVPKLPLDVVIYKVVGVDASLLNWEILNHLETTEYMYIIKDGKLRLDIDINQSYVGKYYKHIISEYNLIKDKLNDISKKSLKELCQKYCLDKKIHCYSTKKSLSRTILKHINENIHESYFDFYPKK